jgi:hypothetical protein
MALSIDWITRIITVPQSYLDLVSGAIYNLDTHQFKKDINDIMDNAEGMVNPDVISHNTVVVLGGIPYARTIEIINGYTVTFEDVGTPYAVNFLGSNNNIADVTNVNNVSIRPNNSAGLIDNTIGIEDTYAPTWDTTTGIINAYQNGSLINITWGSASDKNEVRYNIYISKFDTDIFSSSNLLTASQGHFLSISSDTAEPLQDLTTYYIGVRAIDIAGNETSNSNYANVEYIAVVDSGVLTQEQHDKLMESSSKSDVINAAFL